MSTITLHRIKKSDMGTLYVSDRYRVYTDKIINVPKEYQMTGVQVNDTYMEWMANEVFPIIEHHNGGVVIDRWAVSNAEDPYHVTIAMSVNDKVVHLDLLQNTTSFNTSQAEAEKIANELYQAIH